MLFNLDGSENEDSFSIYGERPIYLSKVISSNEYVIFTYNSVTYNTSTNKINYSTAYLDDYTYSIDISSYKNEWEEIGWLALSSTFDCLDSLYNQATNSNLYK